MRRWCSDVLACRGPASVLVPARLLFRIGRLHRRLAVVVARGVAERVSAVQHGVVELVVDDGCGQEVLDASADDVPGQNAVDAGPALRVDLQQVLHQVTQWCTDNQASERVHTQNVTQCYVTRKNEHGRYGGT